jgi:predicted nucleic acid-binding Zn ribbon protein
VRKKKSIHGHCACEEALSKVEKRKKNEMVHLVRVGIKER